MYGEKIIERNKQEREKGRERETKKREGEKILACFFITLNKYKQN